MINARRCSRCYPRELFPVDLAIRTTIRSESGTSIAVTVMITGKASEAVIRRMEKWGINTIANWSSAEIMKMNRKAFVTSMRTAGVEGRLMGLADVYAPGFEENLDEAMRNSVGVQKENPWVIGFFVGNEPAWIGNEERVCAIIMEGRGLPHQAKLTEYFACTESPESSRKFI